MTELRYDYIEPNVCREAAFNLCDILNYVFTVIMIIIMMTSTGGLTATCTATFGLSLPCKLELHEDLKIVLEMMLVYS